LARLGAEESLYRLDLREQAHQIVLAADSEHGIDHIVTHTLLAHLHFQALGRRKASRSSSLKKVLTAGRSLFSTMDAE